MHRYGPTSQWQDMQQMPASNTCFHAAEKKKASHDMSERLNPLAIGFWSAARPCKIAHASRVLIADAKPDEPLDRAVSGVTHERRCANEAVALKAWTQMRFRDPHRASSVHTYACSA